MFGEGLIIKGLALVAALPALRRASIGTDAANDGTDPDRPTPAPIALTIPTEPDEDVCAWPVDPDEVPGWRLTAEERAGARGYVLPGYRTRRAFDAAVAACIAAEMRAGATAIDIVTDAAHAPAVPAVSEDDAIREFAGEMAGREVKSEDARDTYAKLAPERGWPPVSPRGMGLSLVRKHNVVKIVTDERKNGKGRRLTTYRFPDQLAAHRVAA